MVWRPPLVDPEKNMSDCLIGLDDWTSIQTIPLAESPMSPGSPTPTPNPTPTPPPPSDHQTDVLTLGQAVPLGDLATRVIADLPPVLAGGARRRRAQHQASQYGVGAAGAGRVGVHQQELHAGVSQALVGGQVEDKELVEDGVGGALLHVGLLLADALFPLVHVDLDVWIWI